MVVPVTETSYSLSSIVKEKRFYVPRYRPPGYSTFRLQSIKKMKANNVFYVTLKNTTSAQIRTPLWTIPPENFINGELVELNNIEAPGVYLEISDLFAKYLESGRLRENFHENEINAIQDKYPWKFL